MAKKARPSRAKVRAALQAQMTARGQVGEHYADMLEDYMALYDLKTDLVRDIKDRGAKVEVLMANGTGNTKTNDSVPDLLKVNGQMLKILDSLGIDPADGGGGDEKL